MEAWVRAACLSDSLRKLVELVSSIAGILDGGEELQVAAVGGCQQIPWRPRAVNGLLHRRPFGLPGAIAMFYLAVVLEKGQIVDGGLDPQDEAELVVELQRHRPHRVFDPCSFDANVIAIAGFALKLGAKLAAQEGGDVVRLDGVNRRAGQGAINGRQVRLPFENDIGGIFALIHTPVIRYAEGSMDRAVGARKLIQFAVEPLDLQPIGQLSSPLANCCARCQSTSSTKALSTNLYSMPCLRKREASQL